MARLLLRLSQVPEDEAQAVRELLDQAGIDFYETQAGRWLLGVHALWLTHNEDEAEALALLNAFHQQRQADALAQQAELESQGIQPRFIDRLITQPLSIIWRLVVILLILAIGLIPVFWLLFT